MGGRRAGGSSCQRSDLGTQKLQRIESFMWDRALQQVPREIKVIAHGARAWN